MPVDDLSTRWLAPRLAPATVVVYPQIASTNVEAAQLLEAGSLRPPAVIVASRQTAGRGQRHNRWWSDEGSLCASFVMHPHDTSDGGQLPLRAALAVITAIGQYLPRQGLGVKWPNDVLLDGKKLAGILCQRRHGADIIGVGVNVTSDLNAAPPDVSAQAATLAQHCSRPPPRRELLVELWQALLDEFGRGQWHQRFSDLDALSGKVATLEVDGHTLSGRCMGVDHQGRLLVRTETTTRRLVSAVIHQVESTGS